MKNHKLIHDLHKMTGERDELKRDVETLKIDCDSYKKMATGLDEQCNKLDDEIIELKKQNEIKKEQELQGYYQGIKNDIKQVLDGGSCTNGIESTIIGFENNQPIIYRLGALAIEDIEAVIGKVSIKNKKEHSPNAPGMLARHYAPTTKTFLVEDIASMVRSQLGKKIGLLVFKDSLHDPSLTEIILSKKGSMHEAATKLYDSLHELDCKKLDVIIAERLPDIGLGKSINDRLQRATFSS